MRMDALHAVKKDLELDYDPDIKTLKQLCLRADQLEDWQIMLMQNVKTVGSKRSDEWPISIGGVEYKSEETLTIQPSIGQDSSLTFSVINQDGSIDTVADA